MILRNGDVEKREFEIIHSPTEKSKYIISLFNNNNNIEITYDYVKYIDQNKTGVFQEKLKYSNEDFQQYTNRRSSFGYEHISKGNKLIYKLSSEPKIVIYDKHEHICIYIIDKNDKTIINLNLWINIRFLFINESIEKFKSKQFKIDKNGITSANKRLDFNNIQSRKIIEEDNIYVLYKTSYNNIETIYLENKAYNTKILTVNRSINFMIYYPIHGDNIDISNLYKEFRDCIHVEDFDYFNNKQNFNNIVKIVIRNIK